MKDETKPSLLKEVTPSILDAFDLLKSPKDDVKLNGGVKIISGLHNEDDKDVQYVLKRLIRSLGANIPDMRIGYFATLVTLLNKFDQISIAQIFELVKKELHASGSSKSEVGDVALGQILVCSALFRSGRFLNCTEEEQKQILESLISASNKKSYLTSVAFLLLLDFVKVLDEDQFAGIIWLNIKQHFKKDIKDHNLDSLHFLLVVSVKFPHKVKLRKLLGVTEILCEDNLDVICDKLMAGVDFNSVSHPIYKEIGANIANSPHLVKFWVCGIDKQLVKHNRNRELVSINLLTTILHNLQDNFQVIPDLISPNFFKLFMDWFKGLQTASKIRNKRDDEDDHKIMIKKQKELLNALAKAMKSNKVDNKIRVETLKKLLFYPGEINFTEITGTTVIKSIIADLDADAVKKIAKLLKHVLLNTSKKVLKVDVERNWYNIERVKAAEIISYLVSHEVVKDDTDFKISYMKILMCFGFFKIGGDENVAVSSELAGSIKTCFYRCFSSRFSNIDNLVLVLSSLSNFISAIMKKKQVRVKLEKQFTEENMECWEMLTQMCEQIEKVTSKSKVDNVFLILLYQLGLFLFSEPTHVKIARSSIKELKSCYEHYRKENGKMQRKSTEEPEWVEVLVEVLLSILSVESSVLRSVVQCVFRLLWEYLTPSSVGQIVSVLDPDSEANPLTNDSESEADNDEQDDHSENSSNEDMTDKGVNGHIGNDESDDNDSEADDDDDVDMKTPDQLRMAVQNALGAAALDTDSESIDADTINEEEGKKLDDALADAFRQFHQGKNKKLKRDRKDKKALSDFRVRVLDLIDIYLEKDPAMDICLSLIAPLSKCLEFCIQDNQFIDLEKRIRKTIKILSKIRKFSSVQDIDEEILCDYLKSVVDKGSRSHFMFQALGDVITYFATFIIHCSQKVPSKKMGSPEKKDHMSPLVEIFKDALNSYFHNRNCFLPIIFFHSVLQTEWDGTLDLIPIIIENIFNKSVRHFRRNEAIELVTGFYRSLNRYKPTSEKMIDKLTYLETNFKDRLMGINDDEHFEVKINFITALRKLTNTMRAYHESCHIKTSLDFESLQNILVLLKNTAKVKAKNNGSEISLNSGVKSVKNITNKRKHAHVNGLTNGQINKKIKKVN